MYGRARLGSYTYTYLQDISGADPGIWERGGTTYCFFRTTASLETHASPKKADKRGGGGGGGGGDSDTFFRSAIYVGG